MPWITPRFWRGWQATIIAGVLVFGWIIRYTDQFANVVGIFALGGVLAWLGFVSRGLPKEVLEEMQTKLYTEYFKSGWAQTVGVVCVSTVLLCGNFLGTVAVEAPEAPRQAVSVSPKSGCYEDFSPISNGGPYKSLVLTTWFRPAVQRVKVPGYPYEERTVYPFQVRRLRFPDSSGGRRVVLLQPRPQLAAFCLKNHQRWRICVGGRSWEVDDYHGQGLWIGCMSDVVAPPSLLQRLRRAAVVDFKDDSAADDRRDFQDQVFDFWVTPQSIDELAVTQEVTGADCVKLPERAPVNSPPSVKDLKEEQNKYQAKPGGVYDFVQLWWLETIP